MDNAINNKNLPAITKQGDKVAHSEILPEKKFINRVRQEFLLLPFFFLDKPVRGYMIHEDKKNNIVYKSHVGFNLDCLRVFMYMNEMAFNLGQKYETHKTSIAKVCFGSDGIKEIIRVETALDYIKSFHIEVEFNDKIKKFWRNLIFTDSIYFDDDKNKTGKLTVCINSEYYENIIKNSRRTVNINIKNLNNIKGGGNGDNQRRLFLYLTAINNINKIAIETIFWKANISNAQYDKNMTDKQCKTALRKFKYNIVNGKYNMVIQFIAEQKDCIIELDSNKEFLMFIKKIEDKNNI